MAVDKRSVEITLKLDSSDNESDISSKTSTTSQGNDKGKSSKSVAWAFVVREGEIMINEIISQAEYVWNRDLILDDDYIGQREKQIALTQIGRAVGAASNIISSAAFGASLGGIGGAVVGAVVGTVNQAMSIIHSNYQGKDQQDIMLRQMNNQLNFTRSRVGWSTSAASIGEDL